MMPSLAIVQVESGHWRMPRLWLPLFLLWIPGLVLAPLVVLLGLVCCVAGAGVASGRGILGRDLRAAGNACPRGDARDPGEGAAFVSDFKRREGRTGMNENRRQILEMLAGGKITADEAERLLAALEPEPAAEFAGQTRNGASVKTRAKYLQVLVEADESMTGLKGQTTVNVRVPMQLLRAGVRLASLIPAQAHEHLDEVFERHPTTVSQEHLSNS